MSLVIRKVYVGQVAVLALVFVFGASACGLGGREATANRIVHATNALRSSKSVAGTLSARVTVVKSVKPLVPGPPRVVAGYLPAVPVVIDPASGAAAVALASSADPSTAALVFVGSSVYERIAPKVVTTGARVPGSAVSNLLPLLSASTGQLIAAPESTTSAAVSVTTSTTVPSALRRAPRIVRTWTVFDFGAIPDHDRTKHAGSYAINPADLLRLGRGVLTGSIHRRPAQTVDGVVLTRYDANVSRDKAERSLSEDERKVLDKVFTANAISRRVFPARFWLTGSGALARVEVTLRQQLTNIDRADLTVSLVLSPSSARARVGRPDRRTAVAVRSLGQLVSTASGA